MDRIYATMGKLTSVDFMRIWKQFDKDCSGFLEGKELGNFVREALKRLGESCDDGNVREHQERIMAKFDFNLDSRIELGEFSRVLPVEKNFLAQFPEREKMTREDFDKVFDHYDQNKTNVIDGVELKALIRDLFIKNEMNPSAELVDQYSAAVKGVYDVNENGQLSREDIGLLLTKSM